MATRIATDDAARRQEFIWLGPVDMPWPFEARGSAWLYGIILAPALWVLTYLVIPAVLIEQLVGLPGPIVVLLKIAVSVLAGTGAAVLIVRAVGRHVGPTTPLKHHAAILMHEVSAPRPDSPEVTYRVRLDPDVDLERSPARRTTHRITVTPGLLGPVEADEELPVPEIETRNDELRTEAGGGAPDDIVDARPQTAPHDPVLALYADPGAGLRTTSSVPARDRTSTVCEALSAPLESDEEITHA